jgi:hypothetical protein
MAKMRRAWPDDVHHDGQLAHQCQAFLHARLTDVLIECDGFAGIHTSLILL